MDPQLLDLTGVEVTMRIYRGKTSVFRARFTDVTGAPVSLTAKAVRITVVDKLGGTIRYQHTNLSSEHENAAGGTTLLSIPDTVTSALSGTRNYSWLHLIETIDDNTGDQIPWFHGEVQVQTPPRTT